MKSISIKLISLLLLIAMLIPLAVACTTDPPENNPGGNPGDSPETPEEQFYIEASRSGWDSLDICDFSSQEFADINNKLYNNISSYFTEVDGKPAFRWDSMKMQSVSFTVPEAKRNVNDYYYFEISLYSEQQIKTSVTIRFGDAGSKVLDLNFKGWCTYHIQTDNISAKNPYPSIGCVDFYLSETSFSAIYIGNVKAITPKYSLILPENVNLDDKSEYDSIVKTFRECIVGPETPLDNDAYRIKAKNSQNNGKNNWALFKSTSDKLDTPETLFGIKVFNIDYAGYGTPAINGGRVQDFYAKVYCMAQGYGVPGTELYQNPQLLADIITALEYGYTFYYGKDIVETGVTYGNWWEWSIGIPMYIIDTLAIISDDIESSLISKYLEPFDTIVPLPPGSACNLVDMTLFVILSAALQNDGYRICAAKELMNEVFVYLDEEVEIIKPGDGGFYSDGSFIQHNGTPYAGAYGANMLNSISSVVFLLKDSRFAYHGEYLDRQCEWVLDAFRPFIYGENFMSFLCGRGSSRAQTEKSNLISITASTIKISYYAPAKYKSELQALIKYVMNETGTDFAPKMQYPLISYCYELANDQTVPQLTLLDETIVFGSMDRVVQHTPDYAVGIALSSTRIYKYEAINGENKVGWYHGDGMIFIYTDGYDYGNVFYWFANPYLMPGTTVNNAERVVTTIHPAILNTNPYAGGAAQGKYGAIGYILGYPSDAPAFTCASAKNISAKKSYFMFDDEIVCIGNDIYDNSGTGVRTVVENRLWREDDVLCANGVSIAPATVETVIDARTMHFTNMGGYVFLDNNTVLYSKATNSYNNAHESQSPSGTYDFLEISLSHGSGNVSGGKYTYVYLPEASVSETENYYENPDVEILARRSSVHAVIEKTLGVIGCVFFDNNGASVSSSYTDASAVTKITSENSCSVIIGKNADGSYTVSVADPTQLNLSVKLTVAISGITEIVSADERISATVSDGVVTLTVNTAGTRGTTFDVTVK